MLIKNIIVNCFVSILWVILTIALSCIKKRLNEKVEKITALFYSFGSILLPALFASLTQYDNFNDNGIDRFFLLQLLVFCLITIIVARIIFFKVNYLINLPPATDAVTNGNAGIGLLDPKFNGGCVRNCFN